MLADYLINLPKIVEKKNIFQDEESNNYTLTFETPKIIDVEDLIKKINETNKQNLYKSLKTETKKLLKQRTDLKSNVKISEILKDLDNYPESITN